MNDELERLDRATITLIFALRDSLGDVSALDFWQGRGASAIQTAAAEADAAGHAITRAARKLQIESITGPSAQKIADVTIVIDADYQAWAAHVHRSLVQIFALAYAERDEHRRGKPKPERTPSTPIERPQF